MPESLNRVDDIVVFNRLAEHLVMIIELHLEDLRPPLADRKMSLVLTDAVRGLLLREGFDPNFGAQISDLRRAP